MMIVMGAAREMRLMRVMRATRVTKVMTLKLTAIVTSNCKLGV